MGGLQEEESARGGFCRKWSLDPEEALAAWRWQAEHFCTSPRLSQCLGAGEDPWHVLVEPVPGARGQGSFT